MAKKGGDIGGDVTLGTDAWNVADGFTKLKILRQLIQLDRWETIAKFGTEEVDEDNIYNPNQIKKRRMEALERYIATLRQLIGNTLFALRKKDVPQMEIYLKRLKTISSYIPKTYRQEEGDNVNEDLFEIKENLFRKIVETLQEIKDEINTPLNNAGLIFRPTEEVDLDKIMNEIIEGG